MTELVSVDDYVPRFRPAIRKERPISSRSAEWFTVRFDWQLEKLFLRLLDVIELEYRYFTYTQKQSKRYFELHGKRDVTRAWIPGYLFIETDIRNDYWQQLYEFPGFIDILGNPSPLPPGEIALIEPRFLGRVPPRDQGAKFAIGDTVKVKVGLLATFSGIITAVTRTTATFFVIFCGCPTPATLNFSDIERVV